MRVRPTGVSLIMIYAVQHFSAMRALSVSRRSSATQLRRRIGSRGCGSAARAAGAHRRNGAPASWSLSARQVVHPLLRCDAPSLAQIVPRRRYNEPLRKTPSGTARHAAAVGPTATEDGAARGPMRVARFGSSAFLLLWACAIVAASLYCDCSPPGNMDRRRSSSSAP